MKDKTNHNDQDPAAGSEPVWSELERRELVRVEAAALGVLDSALPDPRLVLLQGLMDAGEGQALTDSERAAVAENSALLESVCARHPALSDLRTRVADDASLFNNAWNEHLTAARAPIPRRRSSRMRWPARIGLGLSAMALAAIIYVAGVREVSRVTVTAPGSTNLLIELADGSTARLSPGSSLEYLKGTKFNRSVALSGSAFFDITSGNTRFTVETEHARTLVLGTRFGVSEQGDYTQVTLVSGKVAVASMTASEDVTILEPGQLTRVGRSSVPIAPMVADLSEALAWTDLMIFRETPMAAVARSIERTRGTRVILDDNIEGLLVTGTFGPEQSASEVLEILAATLDAQILALPDGSYRMQAAVGEEVGMEIR